MRCPKDGTDLIEIERQGIDIDYCPTCKGVWLDRSELDEMISRSTADVSSGYTEEPRREPRRESREKSGGLMGRVGELFDDDRDRDRDRRHRDRDRDWDDDRDDDRYRGGKKKKKNRKREMLEDLFDF